MVPPFSRLFLIIRKEGVARAAGVIDVSAVRWIAAGGWGKFKMTPYQRFVAASGMTNLADGVAVVSAICGQNDPEQAARALCQEWRS